MIKILVKEVLLFWSTFCSTSTFYCLKNHNYWSNKATCWVIDNNLNLQVRPITLPGLRLTLVLISWLFDIFEFLRNHSNSNLCYHEEYQTHRLLMQEYRSVCREIYGQESLKTAWNIRRLETSFDRLLFQVEESVNYLGLSNFKG